MTRIGNPHQQSHISSNVPSAQDNAMSLRRNQPNYQPVEIPLQPGTWQNPQQQTSEPADTPSSALLQQLVSRGGSLSLGQKGEEVRELQQLLNHTGTKPTLRPDGSFGISTEDALQRFQSAHGLTVDGVLGVQSLRAIQQALGIDEHAQVVSTSQKTSPSSVNTVLHDHTARIAELEKEKEKQEHASPIIHVRKLPVHGKLRSIVPEPVRLSEQNRLDTANEDADLHLKGR